MIWTIATLLALGMLAPALHRVFGKATAWICGTVSAALCATYALRLPAPASSAEVEVLSWIPRLGIDLAFRLDGLSGTFALLVTGIGALVLVYAGGYLHGDARQGRFLGYLLLFEGAMLGLVLSEDLFVLFVFWELTSITSFLLIGFNHESADSRRAARQALMVTAGGGLCLLVGIILLRMAAVDLGVDPSAATRVSQVLTIELAAHPTYGAILALVLIGAFTKSAQFPFHFWLPGAMAAPTPVSAFLHSATMVKAGVFLLARLHPVLAGTASWQLAVTTVGVATMLIAAPMAIAQRDLKRVLAYSTVGVLGILTALLGIGTEIAIKAAIVFLVAHAFYKATLFMVAGNLDHETGTRDAVLLGGLGQVMPFTAAAGLVAALSKAGAPPTFGFIGKELLYKAKLEAGGWEGPLILAALITNLVLVASAALTGVKPFIGARRATPKSPHEAPPSMILGPLILGAAGILIGLVPGVFDATLGSAMASAILARPVEMKLALWHGIDPVALTVLGLSAVTLILGVGLFVRLRSRLPKFVALRQQLGRYGLAPAFDKALDRLPNAAGWLTRLLHGGSLRRDAFVVMAACAALFAIPALGAWLPAMELDLGDARAWELVAGIIALGGAAMAALSSSRLMTVAGLGATGTAVSLFFLFLGAPDLAITQIMVETLTVLLFVLVLLRLPPHVIDERVGPRLRDAALALGAGLIIAVVVLSVAPLRMDSAVARYYTEQSVPAAYGRNIVNVILVDFRALDTMGEIVVLAAAGIGVLALLRTKRATREVPPQGERS